MASRSLASRLFRSAAIWAAAVLLAGGITLSEYYRRSIERSFDEQLNFYLRSLVFDLSSHGDLAQVSLATSGDPRFEFPLSGWYWQVSLAGGAPDDVKASRSLFAQTLPRLAELDQSDDLSATREAYIDGPDDQTLRQVERIVVLGSGERYLVAVAGDASEIAAEEQAFNLALAISFALLGLGLAGVATIQVRYGLKPLTRISEQIAAIRAGSMSRLEGEVPAEIAPLARELNALLESNREIVERARTHVGNLAHALKTPLSVITNEANSHDGAFAEKVREQATVMRTQIEHHLERARIAAGTAAVGTVIDAGPVIDALIRAMRKIHADRELVIDTRIESARFRGEQQDLEEMVGNLVDNACKWAASRVSVHLGPEARADASERQWLRVTVDDDGPGLTSAEREAVLARGKRLDETKPGSGLGLSIVSDLALLYGGRFALSSSSAGGLRAELVLPAV